MQHVSFKFINLLFVYSKRYIIEPFDSRFPQIDSMPFLQEFNQSQAIDSMGKNKHYFESLNK